VSTKSGQWRRWAAKLVRHAASVMRGAHSEWGDAMRRELDYIGDDPAALRWALGCVVASYRARLAHRPRPSAALAWRQIATCGVLMLLIGLSLHDNAGGQTEPPRPLSQETRCDMSGHAAEVPLDNADSARRPDGDRDAADFQSDCRAPLASTPETTSGR
jgi:hypothetical protein